MLDYIEKIERLTDGQCKVGPGPFGFGVHTELSSKIGLVITSDPDMFQDTVIMPLEIKNYEISVAGYNTSDSKKLTDSELEIAALDSGDPATQKIANAIKELSKQSFQVSAEDCSDAFDVLAKREIEGVEKNSRENDGMEKPSVLERIREAAKEPKKPHKDKPSRNKSGPEL